MSQQIEKRTKVIFSKVFLARYPLNPSVVFGITQS